jgi:hypothetical protein
VADCSWAAGARGAQREPDSGGDGRAVAGLGVRFSLGTTRNASFEPLLGSWNGHAWQTIPLKLGAGRLDGLAVLSADSAWAVGTAYPTNATAMPLILRWNGHRWLRVAAPSVPGYTYASLLGVAALSATDAWTVGEAENTSNKLRPVIEHWNGHAWSLMKNPAVPPMTALSSVTVEPGGQAWMVGTPFRNTRYGVVLHWTGHGWASVHTPATSTAVGLDAVTHDGNDVWAVGTAADASGNYRPYALRWNGHTWAAVPAGTTAGGQLEAAAPTANGDLQAVGSNGTAALYGQWNGTRWALSSDTHLTQLNAIVSDHGHALWAVGSVSLSSTTFRPVVQVNG